MSKLRTRRERGTAALEFGLWMPVILTLLAGIVDGSLFMSVRHDAILAAVAGARTGALTLEDYPADGSEITEASIDQAVGYLEQAGYSPSQYTVGADWDDFEDLMWITVIVSVDSPTFFPGFSPFDTNVSREFHMVTIEQDDDT